MLFLMAWCLKCVILILVQALPSSKRLLGVIRRRRRLESLLYSKTVVGSSPGRLPQFSVLKLVLVLVLTVCPLISLCHIHKSRLSSLLFLWRNKLTPPPPPPLRFPTLTVRPSACARTTRCRKVAAERRENGAELYRSHTSSSEMPLAAAC